MNIGHAVRAGKKEKEEGKRTVGLQDRTGQDRKKSHKGYISPIWRKAPTEAIYIKIV